MKDSFRTIADLMTRDPVTVSPEQMLGEAVDLMRRQKIRHVPVMADSKVVGIITDRDVKRALPSVFSGNQQEYEQVLTETPVEKVMTRDPFIAGPGDSIKDVLKVMVDRKFGAIPVVDRGKLVGIVTDIDFLRAYYNSLK
jgi:acetoin utilization protein AcuB